MSRRLSQYLKQERRRAGLSQVDVAYLFGSKFKTKISRYERGKHLPPLRTALAYEAVLGVPVSVLFPSASAAARKEVLKRAKRRVELLAKMPETARTAHRKRSLVKLLT